MPTSVACQTPGCYIQAIVRCDSCDRAFCRQHIVVLRRREVAGSMGGSDRLHRYLDTSESATVWLCAACAAFTVPHAALDGARPA